MMSCRRPSLASSHPSMTAAGTLGDGRCLRKSMQGYERSGSMGDVRDLNLELVDFKGGP